MSPTASKLAKNILIVTASMAVLYGPAASAAPSSSQEVAAGRTIAQAINARFTRVSVGNYAITTTVIGSPREAAVCERVKSRALRDVGNAVFKNRIGGYRDNIAVARTLFSLEGYASSSLANAGKSRALQAISDLACRPSVGAVSKTADFISR